MAFTTLPSELEHAFGPGEGKFNLFNNDQNASMELSTNHTDIKTQFENIIEVGFDDLVHFAFGASLSMGAPDPLIYINDLGAVNLPLIESDAWRLLSACGPERIAGAVSSGVWTISSDKVQLRNPSWTSWIRDVAGATAVHALRVNAGEAQFKFCLKRLELIDSDSEVTQLRVQPAGTSTIGELSVILPSQFTGGKMEFHHDGQTKQVDVAEQSAVLTSIVAAYTGVEQTLSAVTSGHRLALIYDIVAEPGSRTPTLADLESPKQRLRELLSAWSRQDVSGHAPQFLATLLKNRYVHSSPPSESGLVGDDKLLLSALRRVAEELGFSLHLANIEVTTKTAYPPDYSLIQGYNQSGVWSEGGSFDTTQDDSFASTFTNEEDSNELVIKEMMDLDGMPVKVEGLDVQSGDLINGPDVILNEADSISFEDEYYESKTYKRTILLVWPESTTSLTVVDGDIREPACNALRGSDSAEPTRKERRLVDKLLKWCITAEHDTELRPVVHLLRECAERWHDIGIFIGTVQACRVDKRIALVGLEGFVSAYRAFGWQAMEDSCTKIMMDEPSDMTRWALLMSLLKAIVEEDDSDAVEWCRQNLAAMVRSLQRVFASWLVCLAILKGSHFLRDVMYGQLVTQPLPVAEFWAPFLRCLYENKAYIVSGDPNAVYAVINDRVKAILADLPVFPTKMVHGQEQGDVQAILDAIYLCLDTGQLTLCESIAERMRNTAASGRCNPNFPPWSYFLTIGCVLDQYIDALPERSALVPSLLPFFEYAVLFVLSPGGDGEPFPANWTRPILTMVLNVARKTGGASSLSALFSRVPQILSSRDTHDLQELARSIVVDLKPSNDAPLAHLEYETLKGRVVEAAVNALNIGHISRLPEIVGVVEFCLDVETPTATQETFLMRMLSPTAGETTIEYNAKFLAPLLFRLHRSFSRRDIDFQAAGLQNVVARIVKLFAENNMPTKPSGFFPIEQLRMIGCHDQACSVCLELKEFVLDDRSMLLFQKVGSKRKHLGEQLEKGGLEGLGFTQTTIKTRTPHILRITKPDRIVEFGRWYANHLTGKRLMALLGATEEQQAILGDGYDRVNATIEGVDSARPPLASLHINQNGTGQKRGQDAVVTVGSSRNTAKKTARDMNVSYLRAIPRYDTAVLYRLCSTKVAWTWA
ncbi:hypothetical protein B0H11DRAFT_156672 [Mycena galericulata]|nr:hypothetical protein B0H11DRAFT_156672 [Mycena galericulata]